MRIESLSLFVSVVQYGTISTAAKINHISQPALSQQIKKLEDELNINLFNRNCSNNRIELTTSGKIFYGYAKKITQLNDEAYINIHNNNINGESIIIGTGLSGGTYVAPDLIRSYKKYYPNVDIKLHMVPGKFLCNNLIDKKYDLIISSIQPNDSKFYSYTLLPDPLELIVPNSYSLGNSIHINKLCNNLIIVREEGSLSRKFLINSLKKCDIKLSDFRQVTEVYTNQAIIQGVEAGLGCGFVPKSSILKFNGPKFKILKVRGLSTSRNINIIKLYDTPKSVAIISFIKFFQSDIWKNELLNK